MSGRHRAGREGAARGARGIRRYLAWGLSAGLFGLVCLVGLLAVVVPAVTGSTPMTILTGSMTPTYPPGTLVIVTPIDPAQITIGTPITYQLESGKDVVVTHRVVSITSSSDGTRSFVTQGDANGAPDEKPVLPVQVRGAVWYAIPWLGYVNTLVNGPAGTWLVPLVAAALLTYACWLLVSALVTGIRRRRARPAATETGLGITASNRGAARLG